MHQGLSSPVKTIKAVERLLPDKRVRVFYGAWMRSRRMKKGTYSQGGTSQMKQAIPWGLGAGGWLNTIEHGRPS